MPKYTVTLELELDLSDAATNVLRLLVLERKAGTQYGDETPARDLDDHPPEGDVCDELLGLGIVDEDLNLTDYGYLIGQQILKA